MHNIWVKSRELSTTTLSFFTEPQHRFSWVVYKSPFHDYWLTGEPVNLPLTTKHSSLKCRIFGGKYANVHLSFLQSPSTAFSGMYTNPPVTTNLRKEKRENCDGDWDILLDEWESHRKPQNSTVAEWCQGGGWWPRGPLRVPTLQARCGQFEGLLGVGDISNDLEEVAG